MRKTQSIQMSLRVIVRGKDGRIIKKTRWKRSRSLVIQFLEILYNQYQGSNIKITTIDNVEDTWTYSQPPMCCALAGNDKTGIVVGTGTATPTNTNYALGTQIAHGSGSGQLMYGSQGFTQPDVVGANVDFILTRTFTNSSGASISVTEVGLYVGEGSSIGTARCVCRDLLSFSVANGASATVEYRIRTTV